MEVISSKWEILVHKLSALRWVLGLAFIALTLLLVGCTGDNVRIDFARREQPTPLPTTSPPSAVAIRMAVAPILPALVTSDIYQQLADYVGEKLGQPVELVQGKTFAEINDLVKSGDASLALVGTLPYLQGREDFGMELLVAPMVNGETFYYSLLIVRRDVEANSLADLRGASFAFSDPMSNAGRLAPLYQLARMGQTPDSFFSRTIFTYSYGGSIRAVADGIVTAAAESSLVFDYLSRAEPALIERIKVVERWGPFGINPFVVSPHLDPRLKEQLRQIFLDMDTDPQGKLVLRKIGVDRFVIPDDSIYDSVRLMWSYVRGRGLTP